MAKPFESRIQDLVYNVEVGVGLRIIKTGVYMIFIIGTAILFIANSFKGLREAEAMEYGQLARNFAKSNQLITNVIRPGTIYHLVSYTDNYQTLPEAGQGTPLIDQHPDILHPPLYPVLLGAIMKTLPDRLLVFEGGNQRYKLEQWVIIPFGTILCLLTGLFTYLLGKRLFDKRVALLSCTIFFLSNAMWSNAISGLPINLVMFLTILALYTGTVAITNKRNHTRVWRWLIPLAISMTCVPLAFLSRYAALALLPCIMLYIGLGFKTRGWLWSLLVLFVFLVGISPWIARNMSVAGTPFGFAPNTCYSNTRFALERRLAPPDNEQEKRALALKGRIVQNITQIYQQLTSQFSDGILSALFLATFFFRFAHAPTQYIRWGILVGLVFLLIAAGVWGKSVFHLKMIFWPLVILYGSGFFFLLLDRLEYNIKIINMLIVALLIFLSAFPLILTLMPPREESPDPPYSTQNLHNVCRMINPGELICTDMPWATAWYGQDNSVLLPNTLNEYYNINDYTKYISGLYLTTLTLNKPYIQNMQQNGPELDWFRLSLGRPPADFPLSKPYPLGTQLFWTDRDRWKEVQAKRRNRAAN